MLPLSTSTSTTDADVKRPKTPLKPAAPQDFSKTTSIFSLTFLHYPRSCLLLFILLVQVFILYYTSHRPPSLSTASPPLTITTTITAISPTTTTSPTPITTTTSPTPITITTSSTPITTTTSPTPITTTTAISTTTTASPSPITTTTIASTTTPGCENGKFFIYDLPPFFNSDIYSDCDTLSPFQSQCKALSNNGFGPKTLGIDHIIPKNLSDAFFFTDQFASEILFHNRLKHHTCRTRDPQSATAYYIPFYAGLAVGKYLWYNYTFQDRDQHCEMMLNWLQSNSQYFNRSNGSDHFLVMGRITWDFRRTEDKNWGSKCIYMPLMKNITRLVIERHPWDYYDIGIPYPTGFHPRSQSDVVLWQDFVLTRQRKSLFCFAGGTRRKFSNDFRAVLLDQCRNSNGSCRVVECGHGQCGNGKSEILETFLDSDFCLQPRGDSLTRKSVFDCMVAGSIPVFFWRRTAYLQYEWFLPNEPDSYSVFIHRNEVGNGTLVKNVLEKYSKEEVKKMREKVVEFIPRIIYSKPNEGLGSVKDAVDVAVDAVLKRVKERREVDLVI